MKRKEIVRRYVRVAAVKANEMMGYEECDERKFVNTRNSANNGLHKSTIPYCKNREGKRGIQERKTGKEKKQKTPRFGKTLDKMIVIAFFSFCAGQMIIHGTKKNHPNLTKTNQY